MITRTYTEKRSFELRNITEEEAHVLYALVNLNDEVILSRVIGTIGGAHLQDNEVQVIACNVRDKIMAMVDGE